MSIFKKICGGICGLSESDRQVIDWIVEVLSLIEKAGPALSLYSCTVQVIYGNLVQVQLTDWYDDFISRFGREHGLDKYFNLCPVEGYDSIYVSLATPKVAGSRKQFMKVLLEEVNGRCGFGYHYDTKLDTIQKGFHE